MLDVAPAAVAVADLPIAILRPEPVVLADAPIVTAFLSIDAVAPSPKLQADVVPLTKKVELSTSIPRYFSIPYNL